MLLMTSHYTRPKGHEDSGKTYSWWDRWELARPPLANNSAKSLNKSFADCDRALEERTGVTIPLIFELEGEEGFRKREKGMLLDLTESDDLVLATGGGVILDEDNRARLRSRGFVIYLNAPIDLLVERTSRDRSRPLLNNDDPQTTLNELMDIRDPLYRQVADLVVKTNRRTARYVVKEILRHLEGL